ncbi:MAG: hypothetical protein LC793_17245 [Thermomicrobia bacterium]|nr:hypothetical protein [Thermomicrobia bacterium]MCA1725792.1 hypothetical protein [Thermomicrobia bacterium]
MIQGNGRQRSSPGSGLDTRIAALDLTDNWPFHVERTGQRPGHYTVWGDPDALLARVTAVIPV